ncbi:MAG: hypothetical protein B0D84_01670, partial [Candidatus Sedimenticola endophacoides]
MDGESNLDIAQLVNQATAAITAVESLAALDEARVRFLGKSGLLTAQLKNLGKLPKESRPQA